MTESESMNTLSVRLRLATLVIIILPTLGILRLVMRRNMGLVDDSSDENCGAGGDGDGDGYGGGNVW